MGGNTGIRWLKSINHKWGLKSLAKRMSASSNATEPAYKQGEDRFR